MAAIPFNISVADAAAQLGIRDSQFDAAPASWQIGLVAMFAIVRGQMDLARDMKMRLLNGEDAQ